MLLNFLVCLKITLICVFAYTPAEAAVQHISALYSISVVGVSHPADAAILPPLGQSRQRGQVHGTHHLHCHAARVPQKLHTQRESCRYQCQVPGGWIATCSLANPRYILARIGSLIYFASLYLSERRRYARLLCYHAEELTTFPST